MRDTLNMFSLNVFLVVAAAPRGVAFDSFMLHKHLADTAAGCAPRLKVKLGNTNPALNANANARTLLSAASVQAAQQRARPLCNLTHLALLSGGCCTSQTMAFFEVAARGILDGAGEISATSARPLSCATALADALGARRVALVGDSVLQQVAQALIGELDASGFSRDHQDRPPADRALNSSSDLPTLRELCDGLVSVSCVIATYTTGLTLINIKAYGFYASQMSAAEQTQAAKSSKPGKGKVTLRTMATLIARTDIVLIEPCAAHLHSPDTYRNSVDTVMDQVALGARWARAWARKTASTGIAASAAGPHARSSSPPHQASPQLARLALIEDVPQQFAGEPQRLGWFTGGYRRAGAHPGCVHDPQNATARVRSRAQLLDLRTYVAQRLAREGASEAATLSAKASRATPVYGRASKGLIRTWWDGILGSREPLSIEDTGNVAADNPPSTSLASVLSPHVVAVSAAMTPLGFMSKCGGRNGNIMGGNVCDCTHYCSSSLTFVPWFTAVHDALPYFAMQHK